MRQSSIPTDAPSDALPTSSLRRNALARLISTGALVVAGFVSAVITSRWLGPAGKGTLSTMLYIAGTASVGASLGIGEAATVTAGGARSRLQEALSSSLSVILVLAAPASAVLLVAAWMAQWGHFIPAVALSCLLIPIRAVSATLTNFQNALERLVASSFIAIVQATVDLVLLIVLVVFLSFGVAGGVASSIGGFACAIFLSARMLAREGLSLRPRWLRLPPRGILHMGTSLAVAQVVVNLAQRFDLVIVYGIRGEESAGLYAVALTLGHVATYPTIALAAAGFPRFPRLDSRDAAALLPRLCRIGLVSAIVSACALAATSPVAIPLLFGRSFAGAVPATLILALGAVLWSEMSLLARSSAARGHSRIQLATFGIHLILMVGFDFILVPDLGVTGAAISSVAASAIALLALVVWYKRLAEARPLAEFIPRRDDAVELWHFVRASTRSSLRFLRQPLRSWR